MKEGKEKPRKTPRRGRNNYKAFLNLIVTHQSPLQLPPRPKVKKK